jgi:hypothetical protein
MKFKRSFLTAALIWLSFLTAAFAYPLDIEISVSKKSPLTISTTLKNISREDQKVSVWFCSYGWSWVASGPEIIVGAESCRKNPLENIHLKPGQEYKRDLAISFSSSAKAGPLYLRMGFSPAGKWTGPRIGLDSKRYELDGIIWSHPITVNITPDMVSKAVPVSQELFDKTQKDFQSQGLESKQL